ncbi:Rsm22-cox11 tandem protein 1, mitochondrial [Auxenochlorella protothecoides]|uniref:Rsm22-cox11 tandem protein 1, mitochondrial n=1 Tax=Auxenochlorella protothecoides TaxID=3075 RepID=A0A087SSA0_AUXPR|nr:Rsm22-cox11 tandem protein 1, mitochondrial [Auxenochlorella protothecoides]KFM28604.1 Rsm22-cox11 tandem protein 1, mitochondrial [Auxenochlorella protothecoides]
MATAARQCRALASLASQSCDGLLGARCMATLPAALASQVATRSPGSIDLPADVNDALLAAAKGARKKHLRGQGAALTDELKHMSRSRHRGGVHPNLHGVPEAQTQRPTRGKARQQRRTLLAELAGEVPGLPMAARTRSDAEAGAASSVYWTARLGPASRRADLVTAGYVLGELDGDGERRRLVADLWARVAPGGVLLLVEPGTPAGSRAVAAARTQVLEAAADGEGSGAGQGRRAHVLAPCPHDGACPLEGAATWCHFVQRFQRGPLQRAAKDFAPGKVTVRSYADERFSYVAICKRPRPHGPPQPAIDALIPLPDDVMEAYRALPPHEVPRRARPQLGLPEDIEGPKVVENPAAPAGPSGGAAGRMAWADDDAFLLRLAEGRGLLSDLDEDTLQLIRDSIGEDAELGTEDMELRRIGKGELGNEVTGGQWVWGVQLWSGGGNAGNGHDPDLDLETLAQASASTWSRVLRPPLKRGGHVVLDLCSAVESGARGEAVRQTVSRLGSERALGGRGAYRLARGLGWGDLWPADYQDRLPLQRGGAWKKGE